MPMKKKSTKKKQAVLRDPVEMAKRLLAAQNDLANQKMAPMEALQPPAPEVRSRLVYLFKVQLSHREDCPSQLLVVAWSMEEAIRKARKVSPLQRVTNVGEETPYPSTERGYSTLVE